MGPGRGFAFKTPKPTDLEFMRNQIAFKPLFDANGKVTHYVGVQSDVTERERARFALALGRRRRAGALQVGRRGHAAPRSARPCRR